MVAVPADSAFRMQQHAMPFERPGDRMGAGRRAVAGNLRDQIVGEPEFLGEPAEAVDDAVRRPCGRERTDAGDDLLVDHPVGEEFGMVGRNERRLAGTANRGKARLVLGRKVEMADVGEAAERRNLAERRQVAQQRHALQHRHAVDRGHHPDQRHVRPGCDETVDEAQAPLPVRNGQPGARRRRAHRANPARHRPSAICKSPA